jgi:hypothetical protein
MEMWRFETAQFAIVWNISDCESLDLSWDETGETRENLESGLWEAFDSEIVVEWNGLQIGAAYLGQSIYENPSDFRDHIGRNGQALGEKAKREFRKAKADYTKRILYCRDKVQLGVWSKAHYFRSTRDDRAAMAKAKADYLHRCRIAKTGGHGSYFSGMVREAVAEARDYLRKLETPYIRAA